MRNRRLLFQALSVIFLGLALLVTASAQAASATAPSMDCFVCNWGCPNSAVRDAACKEECGGSAYGSCKKGCQGGSNHWLCDGEN